jgi:hypothetical protein
VSQNVAAMDDLLKARQNVAYGRELVANQRRIFERLKWKEADTTEAERTLAQYEQSQKTLENELKNLEKAAGITRQGRAPMTDRSELGRTAKAMVILAVIAVGITAITIGISRWDKWFQSDERRLINPTH